MSSRKRILAHPAVEKMWQEEPSRYDGYDGDYWVGLHDNWCCPHMECHTIHEPTLAKVWEKVAACVPCACSQCCPNDPVQLDGCRCA